MDFTLNEEQQLLDDSLSRFIEKDYDFESRRKCAESSPGFSREHWKLFAELGWLAVPFAEEDGGIGGGAVESVVMFENIGKGLVIEPYLATVVLAGRAIAMVGSSAHKSHYLNGVIDGSMLGAFAYAEPRSRFNPASVTMRAEQTDDGYTLNGDKAFVLNGPSADFFVVTARTDGARFDRNGISLFVVDANAPGIRRRDYQTVDGARVSELSFENTVVAADALMGRAGAAWATLEQVLDEATMAICAEAVGCMSVLCADTVEYCKGRTQFGQPIGKFQVLQHRMVDMFMAHEQTRSLMYMAAIRMDEGYGREAQHVVSALKVQTAKAGTFVGQQAVQLHGGMGMTDEMHIGHYFKRLTAIEKLFGNADHHLDRMAAL